MAISCVPKTTIQASILTLDLKRFNRFACPVREMYSRLNFGYNMSKCVRISNAPDVIGDRNQMVFTYSFVRIPHGCEGGMETSIPRITVCLYPSKIVRARFIYRTSHK